MQGIGKMLSFLLPFFNIHLCLSVSHLHVGTIGSRKRPLEPLKLELELWPGFWELNLRYL